MKYLIPLLLLAACDRRHEYVSSGEECTNAAMTCEQALTRVEKSREVVHKYEIVLNNLKIDEDPSGQYTITHSAFISGCDRMQMEQIKKWVKTTVQQDCKREEPKE